MNPLIACVCISEILSVAAIMFFPARPSKPFSHRLYVRICGPLLGTFRLPFMDGGVYVFQSEPPTTNQF